MLFFHVIARLPKQPWQSVPRNAEHCIGRQANPKHLDKLEFEDATSPSVYDNDKHRTLHELSAATRRLDKLEFEEQISALRSQFSILNS